jgi:hypothetical protein
MVYVYLLLTGRLRLVPVQDVVREVIRAVR